MRSKPDSIPVPAIDSESGTVGPELSRTLGAWHRQFGTKGLHWRTGQRLGARPAPRGGVLFVRMAIMGTPICEVKVVCGR
jgi:hypothetical protein